jgi:hypothetical protein
MSLFKQLALAASLPAMALLTVAKTPVEDVDLRQVNGQDGVNITADLNYKVASYVYTSGGGSITIKDLKIAGGVDVMLDDISKTAFTNDLAPSGVLGVTGGAGLPAFVPTGDVVKVTLIDNPKLKPLNISVGSVSMGNAPGKSFGSITINQADLRGTTGFIWAR